MEKKNNYKTENAITLIALIITVIVLLVLAGVTVNLILRENLLQKAEDAIGIYKDAQENEISDLENVVDRMDAISGNKGETDNPPKPNIPAGNVIKTENNIKYTSDGEGNVIPVPVGFSYAGEGSKETGFVIKNDVDLNEFVWIPVVGMPYSYCRYAFLSSQPEDGMDTSTNSIKIKINPSTPYYCYEALPADEETSVESYGGYYIARYEAGVLSERTSKSTTPTEKPIFKKSTSEQVVYVYNYVKRTEAYSLSKSLYSKEINNVTSKICSSYAWDTALKFIETKNLEWVTNSIGGNYNTSSGGTEQLQPTGYHSVNNIYDMGGNAWEWSTEFFTDNAANNYCFRGGNYMGSPSTSPASGRQTNALAALNGGRSTGFRVALFL